MLGSNPLDPTKSSLPETQLENPMSHKSSNCTINIEEPKCQKTMENPLDPTEEEDAALHIEGEDYNKLDT
jgi:hypothetical protein